MLFVPFISLFILKSLFSFSLYNYDLLDEQDVEKYSFPVTHWIMMGQNENRFGRYAQSDVEMTLHLLESHSKEETSKIHLKETQKRIQEKGFKGNILYNKEKLAHTWTDGTYYLVNKLQRQPMHPENYQELVDNKSGVLLQGYARIQHLLLLFGLLFIYKLKDHREFIIYSTLSIIGVFFFFILWESCSRYLVSLTPLLIILSTMGYFGVDQKQQTHQTKMHKV
ncbi:hypothetical protein LC087_11630 [Bacillus carboniphilus]|uniref:Uncharacterized protein n=1 Tax=Bacillus carboniphilus TaxID=86663 RepID=A0ABY9JT05_9BACI|nr:hypothetical protein [Bacillus carboniphilus]WLR41537.1 hypothetical protein LC087_11630 [Bacillus carboniphilus]